MERLRLTRITRMYGEATLALLVALGIRAIAQPILVEGQRPIALVFAAVAYCVWRIGLGPAIYAAVLGYLLSETLFTSPGSGSSRELAVLVPYYVITAAAIIGVGGALKRSNERLQREANRLDEAFHELNQKDRRLRMALEAGRMGSWEWDLVSQRVFWSPELEAMHGLAPGTFEGTTEAYRADIHPDDLGHVLETVQHELASGATQHRIEYRILRPDGQERWVEGRGLIERDPTGTPVRIHGICTDITERKLAEQAVQHKARELAALYTFSDAMQQPSELQGVYESALNAIYEALQCDRAAILICDDDGVMRFVHWRGLSDAYRAAVEGHSPWKPTDTDPEPFGVEKISEAGLEPELVAVIEREGIGALGFVPLLSEGQLMGKFMVYYDAPHAFADQELDLAMTIGHQIAMAIQRKRMERIQLDSNQALKMSEERFSQFMKHLPGLAWIKDSSGRFVYANEAALAAFQVNAEGLYGHTDEEVFPPEVALKFRRHDDAALRSGTGIQVVETIEHEDGVLQHSLVSKFPIPGPDGGHPFVGGVAVDITDRIMAQDALIDADRRKDEFLATLAHELRNPLAPLRSGLEYIASPESDPQLAHQAQAIMKRQLEHLGRLVDDLLDITRIKRGGLNLRFAECDLRELLETAAQMVEPNLRQANQSFEFEVPDEPLLVRGDADRLIQVFGNLLFNAYKFTPDGGTIRVQAVAERDRATIRIIDTGNGMSEEHLSRVFELFAQVGEHSSNRPVGLGVGLALAKQIVDLHKGQIYATSAGPGRGSTFTVSLVLLRQKPVSSTQRGFGNLAVQAAKRVLVVDDNKDAADTISLLLGIDGHDVSVVYSGLEAIERCEATHPDVVLLDLGMPDLSGYEVAKAILSSDRGAGVRLIALTGWGQEEDFDRSIAAGFQAHLVKPVSLSSLRESIADRGPVPETA